MSRAVSTSVLFAALFGASLALASQEGALVLGSFRVESPGIGDSGAIIIEGSQSAKGVESLTIAAFGKRLDLSSNQLRALRGGMLNGIQLSYEEGYKELGGRTLYLVFSQGFTSGAVVKRFVTVTESGSVKVGDAP